MNHHIGLCMALKLYEYVDTHRLLAAYEDGSLVQFELQSTHWKQLWRVRKHKEAGVWGFFEGNS